MTIYRVGTTYQRTIATFTTWQKAKKLIEEHPLLHLSIQSVEVSWFRWFFLKIIFQ